MSAPPSVPPRRSRLVRAASTVGIVLVTAVTTLVVERGLLHHDDGHGEHDPHGEDGHADEEHPHEGHADEAPRLELSAERLQSAGIEVAEARPGNVVQTVELPGEIVLNGEAMAHVGPRVNGTVRSIAKTLGDVVARGDVLAVLDSADVAEMQGDVQAAAEHLKLAEAEYERKKKLYEEKITSQKDFLAAKQDFAQAQVELRSAQRALAARVGGTALGGGYALVAPLGGTIVDWHIGVGEVLEVDARAFTIADLSSIWVNVTVYAKDVPKVAVGQRALVHAEGIDEPVEGRISFISPTVNELTRSATARIVLSELGASWRPGLFVTAAVEVAEEKADLVVPEAALQRLAGKHVVFVRDDDAFEVHPVALGRHGHVGDARVVEITTGLEPGAVIATTNSFLLKAELGKGSAGHQH